MKNILITGGAGFIGSNISLKLISKGYNVTVLDNLSRQIHGDKPEENSPLYLSIKDKVNFIKGSINDKFLLEKAIIDQDAIIHLAAETGTGQSMYEIQKYSDINVGGTALMLDILANSKHNVKKVIVASSRSIYGEGKYLSSKYGIVYPKHRKAFDMDRGDFEVSYLDDNNLQILSTDEDSKIHPSSVYGITKQNQEQMIMTVCPTIGISSVAFRYQNVYGPGQSLSNPYTGILSIFSTLILSGKELNIFEDGLESRDFVYIDDVINATILGLELDEANGEIFNVGNGVQTTVLEVASKLIKNYNSNTKIKISGNYRLGDIRHNFADLAKIENNLGFRPKYSFEEGLIKFCDWVKEQKIIESKYENSILEMKNKGLMK
jgi:dTDP-L-rhamnose 4-epimerase